MKIHLIRVQKKIVRDRVAKLILQKCSISALQFTKSRWNEKPVWVFTKVLILYALIKSVLVWPVAREIFEGHAFVVPRSAYGKILLWPSQLASIDIDLFYLVLVIFLAAAFFLRPNYIIHGIFFWMMLNLFRVNYPITNGSDFVLVMLSFWSVPVALQKEFSNEQARTVQRAVFNFFVIMIQLHVVFIYLVSGMDKVLSPVWRSGEAFYHIQHIDTMLNPFFYSMLDYPQLNWLYSWSTIVFELAFAVLIWFRSTRLFILGMGVIFHLGIWIVLSLPDFAIIMIVSYMIFLRDEDYGRVTARFGMASH